MSFGTRTWRSTASQIGGWIDPKQKAEARIQRRLAAHEARALQKKPASLGRHNSKEKLLPKLQKGSTWGQPKPARQYTRSPTRAATKGAPAQQPQPEMMRSFSPDEVDQMTEAAVKDALDRYKKEHMDARSHAKLAAPGSDPQPRDGAQGKAEHPHHHASPKHGDSDFSHQPGFRTNKYKGKTAEITHARGLDARGGAADEGTSIRSGLLDAPKFGASHISKTMADHFEGGLNLGDGGRMSYIEQFGGRQGGHIGKDSADHFKRGMNLGKGGAMGYKEQFGGHQGKGHANTDTKSSHMTGNCVMRSGREMDLTNGNIEMPHWSKKFDTLITEDHLSVDMVPSKTLHFIQSGPQHADDKFMQAQNKRSSPKRPLNLPFPGVVQKDQAQVWQGASMR